MWELALSKLKLRTYANHWEERGRGKKTTRSKWKV